MSSQIDLKDEKYLKEYEEQIRKLPLGELYEVLGIVKKDSSDERVKIVSARIHELENQTAPNKPTKSEKKSVKKSRRSRRHHRKKSSKLTVADWILLCPMLGLFFMSRFIDNQDNFSVSVDQFLDNSIIYALELAPFVFFGIGMFIARAFPITKKRCFHLGIAAFLMMKAVFGFFFDVYLGISHQFYDEKANAISVAIFIVALAFAINLFRRKIKSPVALNGFVPLALALVAEQMVSLL